MMSARQYAEKYAGQVVKIAPEFEKHYNVPPNTPIGIVVGYKIGTLGKPGSSKVAVWRDKHDFIYALDPKTSTKYNPVIIDAPDRSVGIYFLSVNYIQLLNAPQQTKPIDPYPNHCELCGSPARNGKWFTICSNDHCKANKTTLKALGPFPKIKTKDADGFILCPLCQSNNITPNNNREGEDRQYYLVCRRGHGFRHNWKDGEKLFYQGAHVFVWKNKQATRRASEISASCSTSAGSGTTGSTRQWTRPASRPSR